MMTVRKLTVALGMAILACSAAVRAEDVPAAVPGAPAAPAAPAAPTGGIRELPGTIQNDVAGAVKKDVGGMMPGIAAPGAAAADDEGGEEEGEDEE